jgi:hypothetical protein
MSPPQWRSLANFRCISRLPSTNACVIVFICASVKSLHSFPPVLQNAERNMARNMAVIIAFLSQKSGVGKSTFRRLDAR